MVSISGSYSTINHSDYTEYRVASGSRFALRVGTGETFENALINISNSGAHYDIQCSGANWTFRNVGVKGHFSGGHTEPFRARDTSSSGTSTIENVYIADGQSDSNATGLYVYWNHAGHLNIDRMNVQHWTDNGVYASGPGNTSSHPLPGSGGTVAITNTYSRRNHKANLRLGTTGSYCQNCVMVNAVHRGYWGFYEDTDLIDCDIVSSGSADIAISDSHWDQPATVTCTNSRWNTETAHGSQSTSQIIGDSVGTPQDRMPTGCPTSAEEAATGVSEPIELDPEPDGVYLSWLNGSDDLRQFQGHTGSFDVSSGIGYENTYALRRSTSGYARIIAPSLDGPRRGETVAQQYRPAESDDMFIFNFAVSSDAERYLAQTRYDTGEIRLGVTTPDGTEWLDTQPLSTSGTRGSWCTMYVDYGDTNHDEIRIWFEDANGDIRGSASATDSTYNSGGVGYAMWTSSGSTTSARADYLRVVDTVEDEPEPITDYTEHVVSAGDTFVKRFSEGETWENHLIDATADGASIDIHCRDAGVTIRNVGIVGPIGDVANSRFRVEARDGNLANEVLVENVYMRGQSSPAADSTGLSVYSHPAHAGHVTFRAVTLRNLPGPGFNTAGSGLPEGSDHPSAPPTAGGGTYRYENCHVTGCGTGQLQVTADGSEISQCFVGDGAGGSVGYSQPWGADGATVSISNSTFMSHDTDLAIGTSAFYGAGNDIYALIDTVRWSTDNIDANATSTSDAGALHPNGHQSSAGSPEWLTPAEVGAPASAEDAANGVRLDPPDTEPGDEPFAIETGSATQITETSARLHGYIDAMGADSATVRFEWREQGDTQWENTPSQSTSAAASFEATIDGLDPLTTYEFRATGVDAHGTTSTGATMTFATTLDATLIDETFDHFDLDGLYAGQTEHFEITGSQ